MPRSNFLLLLLILWGTRLLALEALPLHNDEGLHLTRAVEVWNGHPFWAISDGKIINHWLIAAFYPQNAPVFAGRIATLFVSMIGLAAGCALAKRLSGAAGALLAGGLWIMSPYLFFYERLAFSDAEAGALVVVAVWLALCASRSGRRRDAMLTGLALGAAMLMKFTAAPFALTAALALLVDKTHPPSRRIRLLALVVLVAAACFAAPLGYLLLKGGDLFAIAFGWLGVSSGQGTAFFANIERLWAQLAGFGAFAWSALMLFGLTLLGMSRRAPGRWLVAAWGLPLLVMLLVGREVLSRHYVAALPLALTLAGVGLGAGVRRFRGEQARYLAASAALAALMLGFIPFVLTAYTDPAALPLPEDVRYQHITSHSAGYGLREAVESFPSTLARADLPVIGSMFPDSCRRANFYAASARKLTCADAPGLPQIEAALNERGAVYTLVDGAPLIGVDVNTLDARAALIAVYPRPGENEANASVALWLLEK